MARLFALYPSVNLTREAKELHLCEWESIVEEVGPARFVQAVTDHINDSKFFPTVAELRERSGASRLDQEAVEGNTAWEFVNAYARKYWHPDIGRYSTAPEIPSRAQYALRQIGGLRALTNASNNSWPFLRKEFMEAYRLAPISEQMRPALKELFDESGAKHQVRALIAERSMNSKPQRCRDLKTPAPPQAAPQRIKAKHTVEFLREQLRKLQKN